MDSVKKEIQEDWENREFIEVISEGIKKIAEFLNDFGMYKAINNVIVTKTPCYYQILARCK